MNHDNEVDDRCRIRDDNESEQSELQYTWITALKLSRGIVLGSQEGLGQNKIIKKIPGLV